ncbi:MAG: DnaD domain protein [Erysipelotrichaceae bacterium]
MINKQWYLNTYINRRNWILGNLEKISIDGDEITLVLLIDYFNEFNIFIDYTILATKLKRERNTIDELINRLVGKGYLELVITDSKVVFNIDGIFEEECCGEDVGSNLFEQFEKEFGRPLIRTERETLSMWVNSYDNKFVYYALREAIINEKLSFDYINAILIAWTNKKITVDDIENGRINER